MMKFRINICIVLGVIFLYSCSHSQSEGKLFTSIPSSSSGIEFENTINETDSFNILNFEYIYNGAGVGVGDVNGDGLLDIFFGGNMVTSRLYLNTGNFTFKDITEDANVLTKEWCTGIAMVDINQDGRLDIHVSTITPKLDGHSENLFFINEGNDADNVPSFREMAKALGVADTSYGTQSAFLDYDLDGDLDMYLVTNANELFVRSDPVGQHHDGTGKSVDKLYQNIGNDASGYPHFVDVSKRAGILSEGWGLGIAVSDLNNDDFPDIYVANDFMSNDHFYINNRDGTFEEQSGKRLKHQAMNAMGVDIADLNNDGLNDIVVVDMLPEDNLRQKAMFGDIYYDRFRLAQQRKYDPQYVRNVLQLNNGNGTFSDIGYFAGIHETDWSWSPLIADFDNDGWRDIYITNGYVRDITDLDFGMYGKEIEMFGTKAARRKTLIDAANKLQGINKPNVLFHNNKDLTFTNTAEDWGLALPSYSNGAAYADFDNDGDLDIVVNNLNSKAFLFENHCYKPGDTTRVHNFLRVKLTGLAGNKDGVGAAVSVYAKGTRQFGEYNPQRGFKSTVEPYLHFGLGSTAVIDSVIVRWPRSGVQKFTNVQVNQVLNLREGDSKHIPVQRKTDQSIFARVDPGALGIQFKHSENDFIDYKVTSTLPRQHSKQGPAICSGDINGDGRIDFIVGGSAHRPAVAFIQSSRGTFNRFDLPEKSQEDTGLLLFDADDDGDLDLYCVSGGSEFGTNVDKYIHRLYWNTGHGKFELSTRSIPAVTSSGSCVVAQDFDRDGDLDLFIGGRVRPGHYPMSPESSILQNEGKGVFSNVTDAIAPELKHVGMVSAAVWTDFDNDGWSDLLVVGEFMPITFFKNMDGKKISSTPELTVNNSTGWWNSIAGGDIDQDGDTDYIIGNVGLNSRYKASVSEPVSVYAKDFDQNGSTDPIISRYIAGSEFPVHPRETLTGQIVAFKRRLLSYERYGKMTMRELLPPEMTEGATILRATELRSCILENAGGNHFILKPLPDAAQFAPIYGTLLRDVNDDGSLDIISVGNDYSCEPLSGYHDAGMGNCLMNDGEGNFKASPVTASGFAVRGDAKGLISFPMNNKELFIATQNMDSLVVFSIPYAAEASYITLKSDDVYAEIYSHGVFRKAEGFLGESYLSQSPFVVRMSSATDSIIVVNAAGKRTAIKNRHIGNVKVREKVAALP